MPDISKGKLFCCGPFFFVLAAFILSQIGSKQCHYASIPQDSYLNSRFLATDLGMWCYTVEGGRTVKYSNDGSRLDDDLKGTTFRAAQGLSIATTALGAIVIILFAFEPCCPIGGPKMHGCLGILLLATCICEGCCFIFLNSELCTCVDPQGVADPCSCGLGTGGNCGIAACVLWFVSAVLSCGLAKADPGAGEEGGEGSREEAGESAE